MPTAACRRADDRRQTRLVWQVRTRSQVGLAIETLTASRSRFKQPIDGEACYVIDRETRDLLFRVGGTIELMRPLIGEFEHFSNGIQREDVLCDLRV